MSKLALVLVALVASACTFKASGPARAANYDYNEYETYDQPHAQPVSWGSGRQAFVDRSVSAEAPSDGAAAE
jgi:hypothetical protein